jgi:N-methylhydantoinase A
MNMGNYFIGVDIGGTFTDVIVSDGVRFWEGKSETTPGALEEGLLAALEAAAREVGVGRAQMLRQTRILTHGTTIITNILAQLNGARTGLITTRGFRDLLHIARSPRTNDLDYFKQISPPELVSRNCIVEVTERIDYSGKIVLPIEEAEVRMKLRELVENQGCQAIAVCFLFSFRDPSHEQAVKRIATELYPDIYLSISSEINPVFREYERMMTTILNAYSGRGFARYIDNVETRLREEGFAGSFLVMQSNGGSISADEARTRPITLAVSGPAGGIVSSGFLGRTVGEENLITADMGGTSLDSSLIFKGEPITQSRARIGPFGTNLPILDISAIGAGGGSLGWIDNRGMLRVGPESAGADPGPAAYGKGGVRPTVTDAAVALGFIDPDYFLGGSISLDRERAQRAIKEFIGGPLGIGIEEAAVGIYRTISANMGNALRNVTIEKGFDPRDFVLMAYGGCSGLFIASISRELNVRTILVPERAAVFSALGACLADVRRETAQTFYRSLPLPLDEFNAAFGKLAEHAYALVERDGISREDINLSYEVDMRIHGQIWEISVQLPSLPLDPRSGNNQIYRAFMAEYGRKYGDGLVGAPEQCDVLNIRVVATGRKPKPGFARIDTGRRLHPTDALKGSRPVFLPELGSWQDTVVIDGEQLEVGMAYEGPCIVERKNTTVYVPPAWRIEVDGYQNCRLHLVS